MGWKLNHEPLVLRSEEDWVSERDSHERPYSARHAHKPDKYPCLAYGYAEDNPNGPYEVNYTFVYMDHAKLLGPDSSTEITGVTYRPWTNGYAVGFEVTSPDGKKEYVYLNPSSETDDGKPDVFLYHGPHADPGQDASIIFVCPLSDPFEG